MRDDEYPAAFLWVALAIVAVIIFVAKVHAVTGEPVTSILMMR